MPLEWHEALCLSPAEAFKAWRAEKSRSQLEAAKRKVGW